MERVETFMSTKRDFVIRGLELGPAGPDGSRSIKSGTVMDTTAFDYSRNANALAVLTLAREQLRNMRNALNTNPNLYNPLNPDDPVVGQVFRAIVPPTDEDIINLVATIIRPAAKYHSAVIDAEKKVATPGYTPPYPPIDNNNTLVQQLYSAINQSKSLNGIENQPQKDNALNEAFQKYLGGTGGSLPPATSYGSDNNNNGLIGKIVDIALAITNPNGKDGGGVTARMNKIPNSTIAYQMAVAAIKDLNAKIEDAALRPLITACQALAANNAGADAALRALQAAIPLNPHASASVIAEAQAEVTRLTLPGGGGLARGPAFVAALQYASAALITAANIIYPPGADPAGDAYDGAEALRNAAAPAAARAVEAAEVATAAIAEMRRNPAPNAGIRDQHAAGILALQQAVDAMRHANTIMRNVNLNLADVDPVAGAGANQAGADADAALQALAVTAALDAAPVPLDRPTAANLRTIANACNAAAVAGAPNGIAAFVGGRRNRSSPRKSRKLRENIRRRRNTRRSKH